jgi:hypothetical protein
VYFVFGMWFVAACFLAANDISTGEETDAVRSAILGATWPIYVSAFIMALAWRFATLGRECSSHKSAHLTPKRSYDVDFR